MAEIGLKLESPSLKAGDIGVFIDAKKLSLTWGDRRDMKAATLEALTNLIGTGKDHTGKTNVNFKPMFESAIKKGPVWTNFPTAKPSAATKFDLRVTIHFKKPSATEEQELAGAVTLTLEPPIVIPTVTGPAEGKVHPDAVDEVNTGSKAMGQALRAIFKKTAKGRSAPGTTGVNHIHVGGNAHDNVLFDTTTDPWTVLGTVDGHMDSSAPPTVKSQEKRVMDRQKTKSTAVVYKMEGDGIVKK